MAANSQTPSERARSRANTKEIASSHKAVRTKQKRAEQPRSEPSFTANPSEKNNVKVQWKSSSASDAKPSAAKSYAIEMTSHGVKSAIHGASTNNDADARTKSAAPRDTPPRQQSAKSGVASGKKGPAFAQPKSRVSFTTDYPAGPISSARETSHEAPVNSRQFSAPTRPQPAVGKSFDQHASEALSVANSGRERPSAQSAKVPSKSSAPKSEPSGSVKVNSKADIAGQREQSRTSGRSAAPAKSVESANVDAVSGLEPSRAKRKAVKAARNLDVAEKTHASSAKFRAKKEAQWQETRDASKRQGPLDRLVNGPKEKPDKRLGPVGHAARKAVSAAGAANSDRRLGKAQSKYEKAKGTAETHHDEIRAGNRRGSNSNIGAIAGAAGRTVAKGTKTLAEGAVAIGKAEIGGVKNLAKAYAVNKEAKSIESGRAPQPQGQSNRNINPRQFKGE